MSEEGKAFLKRAKTECPNLLGSNPAVLDQEALEALILWTFNAGEMSANAKWGEIIKEAKAKFTP